MVQFGGSFGWQWIFFATNNGVWLLAFTLGDATQVVSERVNV
jgi:hypothetical protein